MCIKDLLFVVTMPLKMLTWTRLEASRYDVKKETSLPATSSDDNDDDVTAVTSANGEAASITGRNKVLQQGPPPLPPLCSAVVLDQLHGGGDSVQFARSSTSTFAAAAVPAAAATISSYDSSVCGFCSIDVGLIPGCRFQYDNCSQLEDIDNIRNSITSCESSTFYSPVSSIRSPSVRSDKSSSSSLTLTVADDVFGAASLKNANEQSNGERHQSGCRLGFAELNVQTLNVLDLPDCISSLYHLERRQNRHDTDNSEVADDDVSIATSTASSDRVFFPQHSAKKNRNQRQSHFQSVAYCNCPLNNKNNSQLRFHATDLHSVEEKFLSGTQHQLELDSNDNQVPFKAYVECDCISLPMTKTSSDLSVPPRFYGVAKDCASESSCKSNVDIDVTSNCQGARLEQQQQHFRAAADEAVAADDNSNAALTSGDVTESRAMYVRRVVNEIVETERSYVRDLEQVIQGYHDHMVQRSVDLGMDGEEISCLFGNIQQICDFNSQLLLELERNHDNPVRVAQCFVDHAEGFVIYSDYCSNYPRSVAVLTTYMKDPQVSLTIRCQQLALEHRLPLGSYLLKPVQRVLKYHLFLQNMLNHYDKNDTGRDVIECALCSMVDVAKRINEMKRRHERTVRVQEIQSRLVGWDGCDDLTDLGDLVLEDKLRVTGIRERRLFFLFEKALLVVKRKSSDESLSVKTFIACCHLVLIETVIKQPLSFQIVPLDCPRAQFTVQAGKIEQKRLWCQHIRRLILREFHMADDTKWVTSCKPKHRRKDGSTLERAVKKRGRKLTGLLCVPASKHLESALPTPINVFEQSSSIDEPNECEVTSDGGNSSDLKTIMSADSSGLVKRQILPAAEKVQKCDDVISDRDSTVEADEVFPWPLPDLLDHRREPHQFQTEEGCSDSCQGSVRSYVTPKNSAAAAAAALRRGRQRSPRLSSVLLPRVQNALQSTSAENSDVNGLQVPNDEKPRNLSLSHVSTVTDRAGNSCGLPVTIDSRTIYLERSPSMLRRRDSIALRKSKLFRRMSTFSRCRPTDTCPDLH